jgi:hypothetical protein
MLPDETFEAWSRAAWDAWEAAGHYEKACDGPDADNGICFTCEQPIPVPHLIRVTGEDINGAVATPSQNPVARAARRAFPGAWWVRASSGVLVVTDRHAERQWTLDFEPAAFLAACLDGGRAGAFSFIIPAEADYTQAWRNTASGAREFPAAERRAS